MNEETVTANTELPPTTLVPVCSFCSREIESEEALCANCKRCTACRPRCVGCGLCVQCCPKNGDCKPEWVAY